MILENWVEKINWIKKIRCINGWLVLLMFDWCFIQKKIFLNSFFWPSHSVIRECCDGKCDKVKWSYESNEHGFRRNGPLCFDWHSFQNRKFCPDEYNCYWLMKLCLEHFKFNKWIVIEKEILKN